MLGAGLPKDGDIEGYKNDEFWRVIFGFPIIFCALMILIFVCLIPVDSIQFSISKGKIDDAKYLIKKVYPISEDHDHLLDFITKSI